jgi:hypothetical protein
LEPPAFSESLQPANVTDPALVTSPMMPTYRLNNEAT